MKEFPRSTSQTRIVDGVVFPPNWRKAQHGKLNAHEPSERQMPAPPVAAAIPKPTFK